MSVSLDEVHLFARLARLRLGPEEAERLRADLSRILEHVDGLGDLVEESSTATQAAGVAPGEPETWRGAVAEESTRLGPDTLARAPEQMAPAWRDGLFLVPPPEGVDPEGP